MLTNPLQAVREGAAQIASRAAHVRLVADSIDAYAETLSVSRTDRPTLDPACHYIGHGEDTLAFVLTLDSINFGSGYFPYLRKLPGKSGYFTIATALTEHFRNHGPWRPTELAALTPRCCAEVFGQTMSEPVGELMRMYARALNDLGTLLLRYHGGSFGDLVATAEGSAARLVKELVRMPLFNDVSHYGTITVAFYKRAQLTAADLALAFNGEGPGAFNDLPSLTIFADNLVPHVLRCDGLLMYSDSLSNAVDSGTLIPSGSEQEIEIRACAVHAVECLVDSMRRSGRGTTAMQLDHLLWNRGQGSMYKARPRHRTRTPFY